MSKADEWRVLDSLCASLRIILVGNNVGGGATRLVGAARVDDALHFTLERSYLRLQPKSRVNALTMVWG